MKESARYAKIVEWSEEDQCFVGSSPGLIYGGCHGADEKAVFEQLCLAWISRRGIPLRICCIERQIGVARQASIRRVEPFHHGTFTGESSMPESMMMGRWARRWKRTVTSDASTVTVAGMLIWSRKMWPAWASA